MSNDTMTPVRDAVRIFNKYLLNPAMLHLAGRKHWYAGFIFSLPYGTGVDWLRNVLAAGRAAVTVDGQTYDAVEPEILDAAAASPQLSARRRRAFQRFRIDNYLKGKLAK
jgi:hypothetical protein